MSILAAGLILGQLVGGGGVGQLVGGGGVGLTSAFTIGDRSEFRVRSVPEGFGNRVGEDVETTILSSLVFHLPRSEYVVGYTPRLVYNDIEGDRGLSLMHTGHVAGSWWSHRARITLSIDGAVGSQSAVGLGAPIQFADISTATPTPMAPPVNYVQYRPGLRLEVLTLGSLRGSLGATYTFSRRWTGAASGYYVMQGGFGFESQQAFPPSYGPGAEVSAAYKVSRRTDVTTRLRGSETVVLRTPQLGYFRGFIGGTFVTAEALESIRYSFSNRTQAGLGGGVSILAGPRTIDGRTVAVLDGAGAATLAHTTPFRGGALLSLSSNVSVASGYNPVLGIVQQQGTASLSASWDKKRFGAGLVLGAVTSLPTALGDPDKSRSVQGSATLGYTPVPTLTFQTGFRGYDQLIAPKIIGPLGVQTVVPNPGIQWTVFIAAQITTAPIEL